ncbi:glyoxalase family protein [Alkalicoccus daliensis]|uniref:Glyoxalase family protein n=2 Tax=Alkalicoccus daliensis TaxID=745820 RepID=A0A1H0AKM8_9BACI|nr:ring-cleaving dioxygenase [Alkalicoccus daliensis]SDN34007.1 glyoxalase family protein [Alkalicoccus daliensis]
MKPLKGIHHVSALTASAKNNLYFYTEILGMRLVKKTVNQDSPSMYHLFYADERGNPGTDFTFFEIPHAAKTYKGSQSISLTSLRVPSDKAIYYWEERLSSFQVTVEQPRNKFGRLTLDFEDFEGQRVQLISDETNSGVAGGRPWSGSNVPVHFAIYGLGPVRLSVKKPHKTKFVLEEVLGFQETGSYEDNGENYLVFSTGEGGTGAEVHVMEDLSASERPGRGSVHHVAFRVDDSEELKKWHSLINEKGYANSGIVERYYFESLYFREPNGILYELATDGPGFESDESFEELGKNLALPPFLETKREEIQAALKPLNN